MGILFGQLNRLNAFNKLEHVVQLHQAKVIVKIDVDIARMYDDFVHVKQLTARLFVCGANANFQIIPFVDGLWKAPSCSYNPSIANNGSAADVSPAALQRHLPRSLADGYVVNVILRLILIRGT